MIGCSSVVVVRGSVDTQSCLFGGNVDTQSCLSVGSVFANRACLVLSVGSVIAGPLVVGPSVELLCCSTSGSWDSNSEVNLNNILHRSAFNGMILGVGKRETRPQSQQEKPSADITK
jgi:hypothetical protein